jgi:hypothetical protein
MRLSRSSIGPPAEQAISAYHTADFPPPDGNNFSLS